MFIGKLSVLAAGLCLLAIFQGCLADDGNAAKCAAESGKECHDCLQYAQCYYCTGTKKCSFYPVKSLIPKHGDCPLGDVRWGACWVNFVALIIVGVCLLVSIVVAICCCCHYKCKKCRVRSVERDERRFAMERQSRLEAQASRREERQSRTDAIRDKYGLPGRNGPPPYQPM